VPALAGWAAAKDPEPVPSRGLAFAAGAQCQLARASGGISVDRVNAFYFFFFAFFVFFLATFFFAFFFAAIGMSSDSSNVSSGSGESTAPQNVNNMSGLQFGMQYPPHVRESGHWR
jgi:hypothetical protein